MIRAIQRRLREAKEQAALRRQEAARQQQLVRDRELEEQRQQRELQEKVLAMLQEGKIPDLNIDISRAI